MGTPVPVCRRCFIQAAEATFVSLEAELEQARGLEVAALADAIEQIGFECTQCGACCTGEEDSEHTATVFPGEVRTIDAAWAEVARPMPYGLADAEDSSETFEWALQTDACGDCMFYESRDKNNEGENEGGRCGIYGDRPLICQTYPFSAVLDAASTNSDTTDDTAGQATAGVVETVGPVNA
ncbi:MAG: putative Fe-S-cluster oxidoreductase, partial [halophilic archaeon J07HX5]